MSTRCQIGFYASAEQSTNRPDVVIYKHSDGYPDGEHGVPATLVPWAQDFEKRRGLAETDYAAARALVALIRASDQLDDVLSYGIDGDRKLHGDINYFYRVDPSGITVFNASYDKGFSGLKKIQFFPIDAPFEVPA